MKLLLITFISSRDANFQLNVFREMTKAVEADKFIFCETRLNFNSENSESFYLPLGSDDGERLMNAFLKGFLKKYDSVLFVRPSTEIGKDKIGAAIQSLKSNMNVLGPCKDGSVYIFGSRHFIPEIFETDFKYKEIAISLKSRKNAYSELPILEIMS